MVFSTSARKRLMFPGFTLLEVMVALLICMLILRGAMSLVSRYVNESSWWRLFESLESAFIFANASALSGISTAGEEVIENVPTKYHLYFERASEVTGYWSIESRPSENPLEWGERITSQRFHDLRVDPLELGKVELFSDDSKNLLGAYQDAVLLTWSRPFAELRFHILEQPLRKNGNDLFEFFVLPPEEKGCESRTCDLHLVYERPKTDQQRSVIVDEKKGFRFQRN